MNDINGINGMNEINEIIECRFCKESDGHLISPCNCSGSMGKIHDHCLRRWVENSGRDTCEACHAKYNKMVVTTGTFSLQNLSTVKKLYEQISSVLTVTTIFGSFSHLLFTLARFISNYYLDQPFTFWHYSTCRLTLFLLYTGIGTVLGLISQITVTINGQQRLLSNQWTQEELAPATIAGFKLVELYIGLRHLQLTGTTVPVVLMIYHGVTGLVHYTVINKLFKWYQQKYIREIYIDRGNVE